MILNEHQKLLANREGMVVLGKKWFNLWLLAAVLFATFLSIAFSNGSMEYLSYKMNDPFTNWVDIEEGYGNGDLEALIEVVEDSAIKHRYLFDDAQVDCFSPYTMASKVGSNQHYLDVRFFGKFKSKLIEAILNEDNVVDGCRISSDDITEETYGVFVTQEALEKLGSRVGDVPAYIYHLSKSDGADVYGHKLIDNEFALVPLPVLAVVKSLPGKMDMIASKFLYNQLKDDYYFPLSLCNEEYRRHILYFVEKGADDFEEAVISFVPDSLKNSRFYIGEVEHPQLKSWKEGKMICVEMGDHLTHIQAYIDLDNRISDAYKDKVTRLYKYDSTDFETESHPYLSLSFYSLDSIRAFEKYVGKEFGVKIEMSQVNAKENFNAVSIMANILSLAMILFSIVCIIMFIVNMMQSYFQKVKRNIGTFKAFGIDSDQLIGVYVLILFVIVLMAIVLSLSLTWVIQILLIAFDVLKDGTHSYLLLWSPKTVMAIVIVLVATVVTVYVVMSRLLKQTPGDLIYDRN